MVTPTIAFEGLDNSDELLTSAPLTNLPNDIDLSFLSEEQQIEFHRVKDLLFNQQFDFGFSQMPDNTSDSLKKVLPTKSSKSMAEWATHLMDTLKSMESDRTIYKGLRNDLDASVNNGKFIADNANLNFNEDFKNSIFRKSFIDYVKSSLNPNGDKKIARYDLFNNAYFTLDLLGVSKEPSSKVKFRNVLNDACHSYYGAYCDYVVSDDDGFLKKSKILYDLLGIKTKVFHIDEFSVLFNELTLIETDAQSFFDRLAKDISEGEIAGSEISEGKDRTETTIKLKSIYLGYFNAVHHVCEDGQYHGFLYRDIQNYSGFTSFKEYEGVINKAVSIFGNDALLQGNYNWDIENKEINDRKWLGRYWRYDNMAIYLKINETSQMFSLQITINGEN